MKERISFRKILPPTFSAVSVTGAGRKGASRWMIYDGDDCYRGDLVRWRPEETWSWQPYSDTDGSGVFSATLEDCLAEIKKLDI
jgi:hypothetical protein